MENPTISISKLPDTSRRAVSSSQLFKRIDKNLQNVQTNRKLQTSKDPRSFRNRIKKQSLDNSKQNVFHHKYISKVKQALKQNQNQMASTYLLSLRKQYDKMEKNIKNHSSKINIMKKDINFMRDKFKNQNEHSIENNLEKLKNKQKQKKQFEQKQQQAIMQTKILNHIITRMKQQHIKNKNIWNHLEKVLKDKTRQLKIKQEEVFQWDQSIHRTSEQITKVRGQYSKRNQDRQMKILDYKNYVTTLEDQQKFQQDRRQRTFQLLSMESNDIMDAKNIVLREVLMTNKVLDNILKFKINNLLNYYQGLQSSYHLIKTQTNISDPQALTRKFFSYAQTFEQLTSKIRYYEQKQQNLLLRNNQLKKLQRQGESKKLQDDKTIFQSCISGQQQRQKLIQQCFQKELAIKKIKSWVDKINELLGLKKSNFVSVQHRLNNICQYMKRQIQQVHKQLIQQKAHKTPTQKFQSAGVRLKKIIKQFSQQQLKLKRNQAMSVNEINNEQNQYLRQSRKAIKNKFLIKIQPSKIVKL